MNTFKNIILSASSNKDARSITLNELNKFWLEYPEEERHSLKSTILALPHSTSLLDSNTLSAIDDQTEFDYIMRIILELEDEDEIMRLSKS